MSTFPRSTIRPLDPALLGDGLTLGTIDAGAGSVRNSVAITGPPGTALTGSTVNFTVVAKTIGIDVQPGTNLNLGKVIMPATSLPQMVTITNTTANPITLGTIVGGADPTEFVIAAPAAAGVVFCGPTAAVPPLGTCSFDITFTPSSTKPVPTAARVATIALTATNTPVVVGASNPPPVTLNLSGTAQVKITTAAANPHGTITPDATVDPVTGGAPAASPVTFTVTPSNKKFKVKEVSDVAGANAAVPVAAPFTINTGAADHIVSATFMQSGDLDADGILNINDALKALKIVAGVQVADIDDPDNSAVKVAPLVNGVPSAINAKLTPDIGDVLVILRRVMNLDTW
jgi:hypothetical protein